VGEQTRPDPPDERLALDVELLPERGSKDSDAAWGERPDSARDLDVRRFLDERPPHHVG
jgi:hypothetical protein